MLLLRLSMTRLTTYAVKWMRPLSPGIRPTLSLA
jgi:hypothetical protein